MFRLWQSGTLSLNCLKNTWKTKLIVPVKKRRGEGKGKRASKQLRSVVISGPLAFL